MIPTTQTPDGDRGTVNVNSSLFAPERREAIRTPEGVVCVRAFGRWYGTPRSRLARTFRKDPS